MSHYFITDNNLKNKEYLLNATILGQELSLFSSSGIFSKKHIDTATLLLLNNIEYNENFKTILDIGTGIGIIGILIAKKLPNSFVTMIDINERAVEIAQKNTVKNNVTNTKVIKSNLFENIQTNSYDLIVTNPPIRCGKQLVFSLYEQSHSHLNEDGTMYVVVGKKQGANSHYNKLSELFKEVSIIIKQDGFWLIKCKK